VPAVPDNRVRHIPAPAEARSLPQRPVEAPRTGWAGGSALPAKGRQPQAGSGQSARSS
jgi:hypothetical protein